MNDPVYTIRGYIPSDQLEMVAGVDEDDLGIYEWEEFRVIGDPTREIVKRNLHVRIKKGVDLFPAQASM